MNVHTVARRTKPTLVVDYEFGIVLDAPPAATVTRRWAESHPNVFFTDDGKGLLAGPDAERQATGVTNDGDYVRYAVAREVAGFLFLDRVA